MRSLVFVEPERVEWTDAPAPRLQGPLEAVVVPVAASRCDFDREIVAGRTPLRPPFAIGHEAVVRVVEVGHGVGAVRPGDLAVLVWHISCGRCDRCRRGLSGHCRRTPPGSSYGVGQVWGGLFDDLVRVPFADAMLTPVPSSISPAEVAAAGDSLSLGHAIISGSLAGGRRRVAVFGRGEHGLYQVAFAVGLGARSVLYVDADAERRELALELGATTVTESPEPSEATYDLIVDASANEQWLQKAVDMLEPGGMIECLGGHFGDIKLPGFRMYVAGTRIGFGLGNNSPHVKPTIDAVAGGMLHPSTLWATQIAWDDLPAAYVDEERKIIAIRPAD